jgi:hypothetical protein
MEGKTFRTWDIREDPLHLTLIDKLYKHHNSGKPSSPISAVSVFRLGILLDLTSI